MPNGPSSCLASAPAATRAVVSRALARSRIAADRAEVLDRAAQVAVAGPGPRQVVHLLDLVVLVGHQQGDRAAEVIAAPDAAEDLDLVGFEPLPAAAAVAALAATQLGVDQLRRRAPRRRESHRPGPAGPCRAIRRRSSIVTYCSVSGYESLAIRRRRIGRAHSTQIATAGTGRFPAPQVRVMLCGAGGFGDGCTGGR